MGFDTSNRLGVDHWCARQMDRRTELALAIAQSNESR